MKKTIYSRYHQEKYGVEKKTRNGFGGETFADIAPLDVLRQSQSAQMKLYKTGNVFLIKEFFEKGGCFLQKVQRQITIDNNIEVLNLFLKYWEYIPTERSYMIKNATLQFVEAYLIKKNLGRQGEEFARNGRFKKEFVARYAHRLNDKAKEICRGFRHIDI